jgi:Carboxypeptidase regulatory-like domain
MRGRPEAGGRSFIVLICSLLMVFEPVFGSGPSLAQPTTSNTAPMLVSLLAGQPELGTDSGLIAVAKLTGTADRNGRPLINGSIVSSGDSLSTHGNSALMLTATPEERLWLGPNTSAKLTKNAANLAVALERGTLGFQTRGHIQITLEQQDGLAIRSRANSLASAQLSFLGEEAQVRLEEGSLELVQGNRSIPLEPASFRSISMTDTGLPAESSTGRHFSAREGSQTESTAGTVKGTVVDSKLFAVSGANVTLTSATGTSLKTVSDAQGRFAFNDVAPGTYTLQVVQTGYPNYEQKDVVVTGGKESSLYVQLGGGGGGTKNKGLLIGVIVGVGAAAGIGAAVAAGGHSSSNSNTTP